MRNMVSTILRQHGTQMTLTRDGAAVAVRGFFQPVRSKSWQSLVPHETPLGEMPRRQYIYIGPADVEASEGNTLTVGEKSYLLLRVETYRYGDEVVYTWGMCMENGADDTQESQS